MTVDLSVQDRDLAHVAFADDVGFLVAPTYLDSLHAERAATLRTPVSRLDDERHDHLAEFPGDVVGIANTFERVQGTDVAMWFF